MLKPYLSGVTASISLASCKIITQPVDVNEQCAVLLNLHKVTDKPSGP